MIFIVDRHIVDGSVGGVASAPRQVPAYILGVSQLIAKVLGEEVAWVVELSEQSGDFGLAGDLIPRFEGVVTELVQVVHSLYHLPASGVQYLLRRSVTP